MLGIVLLPLLTAALVIPAGSPARLAHTFLDGLPGPPFELSGAIQRAIDAGVRIAGIEIGPTRDLTHPVDLVEENFSYLGS